MTRATLVFLILATAIARGDILPNHMIQGGLLTGSIVKLSGGSQSACWIAFGTGAILGALPDLAGIAGGSARGHWDVYMDWHSFSHPVSFIPPIALHLIVDKAFHPPEGGWRKGMIGWVVAIVIVEAVLVYLFIKWVKP